MSKSESFIDKILGPVRKKYQKGAASNEDQVAQAQTTSQDSKSAKQKDQTKLPDLSLPHALTDNLDTIKKSAAKAAESIANATKPDIAKQASVKNPNAPEPETSDNINYKQVEKSYQEGINRLRDLIAPSAMRVDFDQLFISGVYTKTIFVYDYPRFLNANWMSPVVNFDAVMNISQFIYPFNSSVILKVLQKKVVQRT